MTGNLKPGPLVRDAGPFQRLHAIGAAMIEICCSDVSQDAHQNQGRYQHQVDARERREEVWRNTKSSIFNSPQRRPANEKSADHEEDHNVLMLEAGLEIGGSGECRWSFNACDSFIQKTAA